MDRNTLNEGSSTTCADASRATLFWEAGGRGEEIKLAVIREPSLKGSRSASTNSRLVGRLCPPDYCDLFFLIPARDPDNPTRATHNSHLGIFPKDQNLPNDSWKVGAFVLVHKSNIGFNRIDPLLTINNRSAGDAGNGEGFKKFDLEGRCQIGEIPLD